MMLSRRAVPGAPVCVPRAVPGAPCVCPPHTAREAEPTCLLQTSRQGSVRACGPARTLSRSAGSLLPWAGQAGPGTPAPETQPFPLKGSLGSRLNNFTI